MAGILTLFSGRGCKDGCCGGNRHCADENGSAYKSMGLCEADMIKRIPLFRYMKAPVLKIEDLDAQYPYGGQSGWFSLVVSAGQFAYWDAMTSKWCYVKSPEITIEALFSGLGISYKEIADGSFMRWNAEREALEMTTTNTELTVNKNTGKIDLRNSFARKIINGGLSFAASNIYPLISPPEGHRYILYVKSNNGGLVMLPVEPQALFDGKPWILISGVAALNGGLWNKIEVFYSGNEYFVEITNNF